VENVEEMIAINALADPLNVVPINSPIPKFVDRTKMHLVSSRIVNIYCLTLILPFVISKKNINLSIRNSKINPIFCFSDPPACGKDDPCSPPYNVCRKPDTPLAKCGMYKYFKSVIP
jgi:hypothetical protein